MTPGNQKGTQVSPPVKTHDLGIPFSLYANPGFVNTVNNSTMINAADALASGCPSPIDTRTSFIPSMFSNQ